MKDRHCYLICSALFAIAAGIHANEFAAGGFFGAAIWLYLCSIFTKADK